MKKQWQKNECIAMCKRCSLMLDMDPIKAGHGLQQKKKTRGENVIHFLEMRVAICNGFWFDPILLFSI